MNEPASQRIRQRWREVLSSAGEPRFVASACAVGVLTGLAAIGLAELVHAVQWLAIGASDLPSLVVPSLPWYRVVAVPALGGLLVGVIGQLVSREVRGHGVPEVMEAVALRGGRIRKRVVITKSLASALTIGTGGSVGREGPIVQVGASVGSAVGQLLRLPVDRLRTLTAAGAAGGIAAAFNAPIAGAFFALEVIARNFAAPTFGPVVLCAVFATLVSRLYFGEAPAFIVPPFRLGTLWETPLALVLGSLCGLVSVAFVGVLSRLEIAFARLSLPQVVKPALGGLVMGGLLLVSPHLYGVGHATMDAMLSGNLPWITLAVLLVLKPLATSVTLASGGSGGVFLPSLYVGGLAGGLFGAAAAELLGPATSAGAYALMGMAAVLAGTAHAPITAILLAFELTHDYAVILPVMLASAVSTLLARSLRQDSVYTQALRDRGLDVDRREDLVLRRISVGEVMDPDAIAVRADAPLDVVLARLLDGRHAVIFVTDAEQKLIGQISIHDVTTALDDRLELGGVVVAGDICESAAMAQRTTRVDEALDVLARSGRDVLGVVDETDRLVGRLSLRSITDLIAQEALHGEYVGVAAPSERRDHEALRLASDLEVRTVKIPPNAAGRTVRDLDVRSRWNLTVISFRRGGVDEGVDPDRAFASGDVLVVMGSGRDTRRFEEALRRA